MLSLLRSVAGQFNFMADIIVFFDIGDTLAWAEIASDNSVRKLVPFPFVNDVLKKLQEPAPAGGNEIRLGIISNTAGQSMDSMKSLLSNAGLLAAFEPQLLLFSSVEAKDKSDVEFFKLAAERAAAAPSRCIFVGESDAERQVARLAQFRVSFHPLHVFHVIEQMH